MHTSNPPNRRVRSITYAKLINEHYARCALRIDLSRETSERIIDTRELRCSNETIINNSVAMRVAFSDQVLRYCFNRI